MKADSAAHNNGVGQSPNDYMMDWRDPFRSSNVNIRTANGLSQFPMPHLWR